MGGRLGDRLGRRRVYTATLIAYAIGVFLCAIAVNIPMLYVGVVISGFAIGADLPASLALISEEAPAGKKGKMVGSSAVLWLVGLAVVNLLSTFFSGLGATGGRILYAHLFIVAVVTMLLRRTLPESPEWKTARTGSGSEDERVDMSSLRTLFTPRFRAAMISTALFYAFFLIGANTIAQYTIYLYVKVVGVAAPMASFINFMHYPFAFICGWLFMRNVDTRHRYTWYVIGAVTMFVAFSLPIVAGLNVWTLSITIYAFSFGAAFAGEALYKVWSQELFPTLLRGSAQGITFAFARFVAGFFSFAAPIIVAAGPSILFGLITAAMLASSVIGYIWVRPLHKVAGHESVEELAAQTA